MNDAAPPPHEHHALKPLRTLRHLLAPGLWMLLLLLMLCASVAGMASWLLRGEAGTAWLLARLPGVQVSGVQGALLSDQFAVERLHVEVGGALKSISIEGLRADGLIWSWRPDGAAWVGLSAARIHARRVVWHSRTSGGSGPPASLAVPLYAQLAEVKIDELTIDTLPPLRSVQARGTVGAEGGKTHRVDALSFDTDRAHATASGRIDTTKPFALDLQAELQAQRDAAAAWQASLKASGSLAAFAASATLRGTALAGHPAPALDLRAEIRPFAPWPLASLKASTQALDLAALTSLAPKTQLSGSADVLTQSADAPIAVEIKLDNAVPGRWDQQRLPVKRIELKLRAVPKVRDRVDIEHFEILLAGDAKDNAGQLRGSGQWRRDALSVDGQISGLRPHPLDPRAARLTVSGPFKLVLRGLPGPDLTLAPASASGTAELTAEVSGTLDGRFDAAPQPVRVQLDGLFSARRLELRSLRAGAGSAMTKLKALAERTPSGSWTLKSDGSLADFDPVRWWPGVEGSAWRRGPHRLSGVWQLDLKLPPIPPGTTAMLLAQTTTGSGLVRVHDSIVAGVPLQGELSLSNTPAEPTPSSLRGELRSAGTQLLFDGRGNPMGNGSSDRWRAEFKSDALATLAPIVRLWPELAEWAPSAGSMQAQLQGEGRWPDVRSIGQAQFTGMRLGALRLRRGELNWRLDSASDQPLNVQTDLQGLQLEQQQIETLQADLQGTLRQHVLRAQVALPLKPPEWTESLLGMKSQRGTRALLRAEGGWSGDGTGAGSWRGRIAELTAGPWDGSASPAIPTTAASGWLDARDLRAEASFSPRGGLIELRAEAGRAKLADAITLRWDAVALDNRGARPNFNLRAEIEPFLAAPVLARLQPSMGWGGDLLLSATVDIKAADNFDADIVFERRSGDLASDDVAGRHTLGLSAMRLGLSAHDGRWSFVPALTGRTLGELGGRLNLITGANQRWPDAQSAIDGSIEARVADISIWSAWVPPGWRLAGSLTTSASVSGRLGAPEYRGGVQGQNIGVRNLLQGVDVRGGDVAITLKGATAQIERFVLRGGDGQLAVSGNADFGERPVARLQLQAERFRMLGRVDRQLVTSGKATLELRSDSIKLDGELKVDEGIFDVSRNDAPGLDDDVVMRSGTSTAGSTDMRMIIEAQKTPRRSAAVNLQIDLGDKLRVRGRGLDTMLAGQLRVSTPQNRLALHGIVRAVGGTYAAYAQKLEIDRGILSFSGTPDNPGLDILALRPNLDARVGVAIAGSFITPRVRLYSDPEMSDTDKLSWLVLGRPSDGLGRADSALLQRAAVALLAGEGEAPTDAFLRTLGLDELSVRQSDGEVRETVIALGKQLSRRWYLGYERGVNATSGTWQLIYRIAQRFTLRAQSGAENSLDVIWVWRVGEPALLPSLWPGGLPSPVPVRKSIPAADRSASTPP